MIAIILYGVIMLSIAMYLIMWIYFDKKVRSINHCNLTRDDLNFLIELQREMVNQDHVSQAAPRFWTVAGIRKNITSDEYADGEWLICDSETVADGLEESVEYFQKLIEDKSIIITRENTSFVSYKVTKIDNESNEIIDEQDFITAIDELIDVLVSLDVINEEEYSTVCYRSEHYRYPNTMFLTNRSCKEHIAANKHHYDSHAHSYAMTAWRSPEVKKLWHILEKINWESILEDIYGTEPDV